MGWDHVGEVRWVYCESEPTKKLVLLMYAERANEHDEVYAARQWMADQCCITVDTLKRYIREFRDKGILVEVDDGKGRGGRGRTTLYKFVISQIWVHFERLVKEESAGMSEEERRRKGPKMHRRRRIKQGDLSPPLAETGVEKQGSRTPRNRGHEHPETGGRNTPHNKQEKITKRAGAPARAREGARADPPQHAQLEPGEPRIRERWERDLLPRLKQRFGEAAYKSWLEPLAVVADTGDMLILRAETRFMRDYVQNNHAQAIGVYGECVVEVTVGEWPQINERYAQQIADSKARLGIE